MTISEAICASVAEKFGTPTFILDLARLEANHRSIRRAFDDASLPIDILYSAKTNYMPAVLLRAKALGCGVDVVSGIELELARRLGFSPDAIVFNGPHKTDGELAQAVESGIFVNVDGAGEAARIDRLGRRMERRVDVGLRVNPGMSVYPSLDPTYEALAHAAARHSKFGFSIGDGAAAAMAERIHASAHLRLVGIHCHLGSQMTDDEAFGSALDEVFRFVAALRSSAITITRLNIGGGFGVAGIRRDRRGPLRQLLAFHGRDTLGAQKEGLDLGRLASAVARSIERYSLQDVALSCEPGRAIVSDAMTLLARVSSIKRTGGIDWVILDAGLNLMPTIAMDEDHRIVSVARRDAPTKPFRVGGPLCYEGDILAKEKSLPASLTEGDLVLIEDAGAYTVSRSTNFIRPRAAAVLLGEGGTIELCWRRETFDDVFGFARGTRFEA